MNVWQKISAIREITPLSEKDCFYIADRNKNEFTYPIHSHGEYELNFISNASGVKRIVGDSIEIIGDYDLVLIGSKDLEHAWEQNDCKSSNIREITIQFSPDLFSSELLNKNQFNSIRKMLKEAQCGLSFPLPAIMSVYSLLDKLSGEQNGFYAFVSFLKILHELSLHSSEAKRLSTSSFAKIGSHSDSRRIQKVQEYINAHYKEEIRLNELADVAKMTPAAFSRFFKLCTGKGVVDYVIDLRLGYAARLLVDSNMLISEICYDCGFNNVSNFNRLFRKHKKLSPKEFRENYRKKKIVI
ncbi:MAG: AraC family transcriptional regulator [Dysgonamonadaceae bacterium]|jgi:AraC-like DNA-binding protein|nr:AraC family transcriptional regulator [Dysgonamonadaceae bacterium]